LSEPFAGKLHADLRDKYLEILEGSRREKDIE
jgi:hypothetical protein